MSSRFISNIVLGLAGVTVVVTSQAFAPGVTGWVMFVISLGALALLPLVQLDRHADASKVLSTSRPDRPRCGRPSPPLCSPAGR